MQEKVHISENRLFSKYEAENVILRTSPEICTYEEESLFLMLKIKKES